MRRLPNLLLALSFLFLLAERVPAQKREIQARQALRLAKLREIGLPVAPVPEQTTLSDKEILANAKLKPDGDMLLKFFKQRTLNTTNKEQIQALIRQLGDDDFAVREKASAALVSLGGRAVPHLKEAEKDDKQDIEVMRRAGQCRLLIEGEGGAMVSAAAARVVAQLKPEGAAKVLLAYLPFAEDETVADELRNALTKLAVREGKPEKVLVKALEDKSPVKRGAAAEALCRAEVKAELPAVHKLLKDDEPKVRLRAALGLVPHKDKEAVATLITLLAEPKLKEEDTNEAENLLFQLAGDNAPPVELGSDAAARKKCSEAWAKWWKDHEAKVDLVKLGRPVELKGLTLLIQRDLVFKGGGFQTGKVVELDKHKTVLWKIENLNYPVDAQIIGKDRVLVTEYQGRKVTERDLKGAEKWSKTVNGFPLSAQRLANGNTFIVMQNLLLEVNKDGKDVKSIARNGHDVMKAKKLRNGEIAIITNRGMYIRLDAEGKKELKSFNVGWGVQMFGSMDVLPNGHVLVPLSQQNKVVEYDRDGKVYWELEQKNGIQWPTSVTRLPNGQTLVASQSTNQVLLFDRKKKLKWSHSADGQVFQARRR